jgi:hypothetical protein
MPVHSLLTSARSDDSGGQTTQLLQLQRFLKVGAHQLDDFIKGEVMETFGIGLTRRYRDS